MTVYAVTNRDRSADHVGYGSNWGERLNYERFGFSVPLDRKGSTIIYPAREPDPRRQYVVTKRDRLTADAFVENLTNAPGFNGNVAVFVHGYNYSYQEAVFRTAQLVADAKSIGVPIVFSWPSAASVTGYVADRDAALYSRSELNRLLQAVARARNVRNVVVVGHSMGGFLTMEAVRQLSLQGRPDVLAKLEVVLAAPDIDVDVFRSQLRDIGEMHTPITILAARKDRALSVSSFVGGERPRIGLLDIDNPVIEQAARSEHVRVIDISSVQSSDGLGHDRFTTLARFERQLSLSEGRSKSDPSNVGAFVFDAAAGIVSSPFRVAGHLIRQ